MIFKDDRTDDEKLTHHVMIGGTDRCLSGWGGAEGGASFAFWACMPQNRDLVERWVRCRGDIHRVREVTNDYRPKGRAKHVHIYVVRDGHPALGA